MYSGMLHFPLLPSLLTEAFFLFHVLKVNAVQKLCTWKLFDHCGEFYELNAEICPPRVMLSVVNSLHYVAWLPEVIPRFLANMKLVPKVAFLLSNYFPLQGDAR
jgi:hypothetical protein